MSLKKKIIIISVAVILIITVSILANIYRVKSIGEVTGNNINSVSKIELYEDSKITKVITDNQEIKKLVDRIATTKVKKRLDQPSLIRFSNFINLYSGNKTVCRINIPNYSGYLDIGYTEYKLISNELPINNF